MNERKLTKSELAKREDIIMNMKKNKRALVQKYGKDAEAVMYGRATNLAKTKAESMDQDRLKEMIKDALQNPKAADLNKDGKLSDYEKKRGAAIEKNLDEMDLNDPIAIKLRADKAKRAANAGDDGNDKFFRASTANAKKLAALKDKRAQIMRDMEQEAELEGGPIADRYGDMLNKIDKAIAKLEGHGEWGPERDIDISGEEIAKRAAMFGLEEGASSEEKRIAMRAIKSIAKYRGVSNDEARNDLVRAAKEIGDLKEDLDLGHQDNEPHMLKADLYRIGKYAMELYQMVDDFEGKGEVDFPHWWQSKISNAKAAIVGAKHYLDFELKEPQIDAMVDVAQEEDAIDENSAFQKRLAKLAADEKAKRDENPGYAAAGKELGKVDFEDFFKKGQSYQEFKKRLDKLEEGVWSLGSANDIKAAIQTMEMGLDMDDSELEQHLQDNDSYFYNVLGDDLLHDYLGRAYDLSAMGNEDRARNELSDAIGRAYDLLKMVADREGIKEEEAGEADMVASDIQKAMNKHKGDDSKMYQLQKARTAMNKGDLDKAKKIAARLAEKLKSK